MSRIKPSVVICPRCGAACSVRLFESLNGDRIPVQVDAILDGSFERTPCGACGAAFQPEHAMLYAQFSARLWFVMYPVAARADHARLEREVAEVLARNFAEAPVVVADGLRGLRPRLVFGQYGLREAVRAARDAIDPPLLECTKLLAYRNHLSQLFALGPSELVYEGSDGDGQLGFGVRALPTGERLGELWIPARILGETRRLLPELAVSHPALFEGPYISALRYLYPDAPAP
jgi:hypothetical protein